MNFDRGTVVARVGGKRIKFIIDSGATVNTISEKAFTELIKIKSFKSKLIDFSESSDNSLTAYATSKPLQILATFWTDVWIDSIRPHTIERFFVVKNSSSSLMGRNTALRQRVLQMGLSVPTDINLIAQSSCTEKDPFRKLTSKPAFPKFNIEPVRIQVRHDIKVRRCTYSNIQPAFREVARKRIQELLQLGIIEEISDGMSKEFCSALLVVPKGNGDARLVVDLRGPNKCIIREPHRMPTFETITTKLHDAEIFSTIDLTNAFNHVVLHEDSRHLTNFFSGDRFYRFTRLPFGLCNAPDVFQCALEQILKDCPNVVIYLDDILVYGSSYVEHDANLEKVLKTLNEHNVELNNDKCKFRQKSVTFLGFKLCAGGYKITDEKLEAIRNFRTPSSIEEVRSFLGLMNFVDKFIHNRADMTHKLRDLIKSKTFIWNEDTQKEFDFMRLEALDRIKKLGFFNKNDKTELIVDASPIGLGAVLVQRDSNNKPRIIACASKALADSEKRYPQTHREALAIIWGVQRFQYFLYGIDFVIKTDAEANKFLFGGEHQIGRRAISRAESWAIKLMPFRFEMEHIPGNENIADVFSRLIKDSQSDGEVDSAMEERLFSISNEEISITWDEVELETSKDPILQEVLGSLKSDNWPPSLTKFECQKRFLTTSNGVIFFKEKMVVPASLQQKTLKAAHEGHFGMGTMKRILRKAVWWPGINVETEQMVQKCKICQQTSRPPRPVPIRSRDLPDGPWEIVQIDFLKLTGCGSGEFLVVTDTYSRYMWVIEMRRTDVDSTITALWDIVTLWGRPDILQSDNGPPFNALDFTTFWKRHGVHHQRVVPYCPFMNGMVERKNQGLIKAVMNAKVENINWRSALHKYVNKYNNECPHPSTNATPFELMVGRRYRGSFPTLTKESSAYDNIEEVGEKDAEAKLKAARYADKRRGAKASDVKEGDWVIITNKQRRNKIDATFLPDHFKVLSRNGPKLLVQKDNGKIFSKWVAHAKRVDHSDPLLDDEPPKDQEIKEGDMVQLAPSSTDFDDRYMVMAKNNNKLLVRSEDGHEISIDDDDASPLIDQAWTEITPIPDDPADIDRNSYPDGELTRSRNGDNSISTDTEHPLDNAMEENSTSVNNDCPIETPEILPRRSARLKEASSRFKDHVLYNLFG